MIPPPSAMFVTTRCPCESIDHVRGNRTVAFFCVIPCARSVPFPTATIIPCEVGSSQPAYILWKYLIAAKYSLTVHCWLLCTKQLDTINSNSSPNT